MRVKFKINFLQRPATSCKEAILRARKVLRQELGSVQDNTEHCTQLEHLLWPENSAQTTQKQIQIRGGLIMGAFLVVTHRFRYFRTTKHFHCLAGFSSCIRFLF